MNHYILVGRDLLHLVWFMAPIGLAAISGAATQRDGHDVAKLSLWLAVLTQCILVLGYVEGWNVR